MDGDGAALARRDGSVSADLLSQIADRSPIVTLVVAAPAFRIVYANGAAHRAARRLAGSLVGQDAAAAFGFVDPTLLAAKSPAQACAVLDSEGDDRTWWDVSYVGLDPGAPETSAVLITAVDVTHHEIGRAKAQDTLDSLLAHIPQGVSIAYGPDVNVARISARAASLIGRDLDELTGRSALEQTDIWDVYQPGSEVPLTPADRPLARATHSGEATINETLLVRRPDGDLLSVLCHSWPIRAADGSVMGAAMVWQDIGDLQRAQAALRDSEERLRAVLLQIPAAIFIIEAADGRVTFRSRLMDDVLGHPSDNLDMAKTTLRGWAVHKDGRPYDLSEYPSRRALMHGETVKAEPMIYVRGDGRLVDLEMYAGPVHDETGEVVAAVAVAIDVTERRQAEARQAFLFRLQDCLRALSEPAEILAAAATLLGRHLGAARIGYCEIQPDDETLLVTNGYADGAPPVHGLFPMAILGAYHEQEMRQGRTIVYEDVQTDNRVIREPGLELGIRAHVNVPRVRDGRFTGSLYVTHLKPYSWTPADIALIEDVAARIWDAAERGRAETRLRESEERLRLALESTGLGSWEYDVVSGKTIRSARHDAIFGYEAPLADWTYDRFNDHVLECDRALVEESFRAALDLGKDWEVEFRFVRADGSPGWLNVRARPQCGSDGKVIRLLGTVADVTERKQAEEAVIQTAAKFETFAQTIPSMIWTSQPDGQIDWFNARVSEYSGVPVEDMKPDGWLPVHPDDLENAIRLWKESLASGAPYETEYRIRRHDGEFRWHLTRAIPIRGADGSISLWIGASADIQDQKSSKQALAELNATLEAQVRERTAELLETEASLRQSQKMEAVGQLTGGLAHDFNNLLTAIAGSLELLANRLAQGRLTELDRYLNTAQAAAKRAAALTHRLLAFSRRQTLDPKPTDINKLIYGMDELIRRTVSPSVTVKVADADGLWTVLADPHQLENALLNLCINARDAMPDGGDLKIETGNLRLAAAEARALDLPAGDYVSLSVSDTGGGMTADVIARAFDPFFTTKPIGQGTGLGLSMVYGFVRQSGGQARIISEPGHGAKVCLYLPRYLGEEKALEPSGTRRKSLSGAGETVVVVDDEPSVRMLICEVLEELGYRVFQAEEAGGGLKILETNIPVDLLVTDVGLPGGMNGRQLADAALVTRPNLKVLFVTGYAESAALRGHHLKPGVHVLTKPFSLETLGERVTEIIGAVRPGA